MHFLLDNLCGICDNEDNGERLLERDTPVRSCDTASLSERFEMSCIHNEILLENLYDEALEICTKRMSVIGSFPWEIKAAAEEMAIEMFEERAI